MKKSPKRKISLKKVLKKGKYHWKKSAKKREFTQKRTKKMILLKQMLKKVSLLKKVLKKGNSLKTSCIRETKHLSTNVNSSSTDTKKILQLRKIHRKKKPFLCSDFTPFMSRSFQI